MDTLLLWINLVSFSAMAFASEFKFTRLLRRTIGNSGRRIIANVWQDRNNQNFIGQSKSSETSEISEQVSPTFLNSEFFTRYHKLC